MSSLALSFLTSSLLSASGAVAATASYNQVKEYSGSGFFDEWNFYGSFDNLTNGDAIFVSKDQSSELAYVDSSTNRAIIKVDNTSTVPFNEKRNTVRIATQERYDVGSLWITDMYHVPFGCSVWPAWWSQAPGWPTGGEIDTFEGVNLVQMNQMALHTTEGCTLSDPVQTSTLINSTDCNFQTNSNEGCVVSTPSSASYGEGFANAGGGVYVTEMSEDGISIWFWSRANVPSAIASNNYSTVNTADLGTPVANWPPGGCDPNKFFEAQQLIFDITLCGDFAGAPTVFSQTCPGTCYNDYVVGNGSAYNNAYFDIAYVKVFSKDGQNTTVDDNSAALVRMPLLSSLAGAAVSAMWYFL